MRRHRVVVLTTVPRRWRKRSSSYAGGEPRVADPDAERWPKQTEPEGVPLVLRRVLMVDAELVES